MAETFADYMLRGGVYGHVFATSKGNDIYTPTHGPIDSQTAQIAIHYRGASGISHRSINHCLSDIALPEFSAEEIRKQASSQIQQKSSQDTSLPLGAASDPALKKYDSPFESVASLFHGQPGSSI